MEFQWNMAKEDLKSRVDRKYSGTFRQTFELKYLRKQNRQRMARLKIRQTTLWKKKLIKLKQMINLDQNQSFF